MGFVPDFLKICYSLCSKDLRGTPIAESNDVAGDQAFPTTRLGAVGRLVSL